MLHEISFLSYDERDTVQAWIYVPAAKIKGIIQLVHGFGEHSRRYLHMISKFVEAGFVVAADDHVGHGKTAMVNDTWGDWGTKGFETMMEDEHILKILVQEKYPNVPYFMYGHSMGSLIARSFSVKYGEELAGVVYCGTLGKDAFPCEKVVGPLKDLVAAGKGKESDPDMLNGLMGGLFARV